MRWHRKLSLLLRSLLLRKQTESELEEELRDHLAQEIEANREAGMQPEEARRTASQQFGNVELHKEECRDQRGLGLFEKLWQDTRYALRGMRLSPALTLTATLTLAICIGANTTVFSLINSVLLRPLPYPSPQQLYWIGEQFGQMESTFVAGPDYYSLRQENRTFTDVASYDTTTMNWSGRERPEQVIAAQVTPSFFHVFATPPLLGRYFTEEEQGSKAPAVVVLSYSFWKDHFASDRDILGKSISLDGLSRAVIGVMPQGFDYPRGTRLWKPLDMDAATQLPRSLTRPMRNVLIVARSRRGETPETIAFELRRLTTQIRREYPLPMQRSPFLEHMKISSV
ncbi:MAG TPA: ABC transporter permease, partial [Bryobacteraceae bacterium]|nr:ABC transporter permease [Bryobacteraceae bacterium]